MQANSVLPSAQVLLRQFAQRHSLEFTDLVKREEIAISKSSMANIVVSQAYGTLEVYLADRAVGLLLNLLHRNFEHIEAAIVAFVTGCGASAEVIARAATECSVNIIYILAGDRVQRLQVYFDHYLADVDRQVEKWEAQIRSLAPRDAAIHKMAAERRRSANNTLRSIVQSALGKPEAPPWPKSIVQRFEAIGDAVAYRTVYGQPNSRPPPMTEWMFARGWEATFSGYDAARDCRRRSLPIAQRFTRRI